MAGCPPAPPPTHTRRHTLQSACHALPSRQQHDPSGVVPHSPLTPTPTPTACSPSPSPSPDHAPLTKPFASPPQEEGFIAKILVGDGTKDIAVGTPVAVLAEEQGDIAAFKDFSPGAAADAGGAAADKPSAAKQEPAAPAVSPKPTSSFPPHEVHTMPSLSPTMTQGNILEWKKKVKGETVCMGLAWAGSAWVVHGWQCMGRLCMGLAWAGSAWVVHGWQCMGRLCMGLAWACWEPCMGGLCVGRAWWAVHERAVHGLCCAWVVHARQCVGGQCMGRWAAVHVLACGRA
eukprot:354837-Chlamydomonas_euryale.AAC.2